jgi:hypothetical protein
MNKSRTLIALPRILSGLSGDLRVPAAKLAEACV